jgi:hypothetical protein
MKPAMQAKVLRVLEEKEFTLWDQTKGSKSIFALLPQPIKISATHCGRIVSQRPLFPN